MGESQSPEHGALDFSNSCCVALGKFPGLSELGVQHLGR